MSSAAHADVLFNPVDPTYEDASQGTSADLFYLLFFFAVSVVAIAKDVFGKSGSKSLKDATWTWLNFVFATRNSHFFHVIRVLYSDTWLSEEVCKRLAGGSYIVTLTYPIYK